MKINIKNGKILIAGIIVILALFIILFANVNAEKGAPPINGGESKADWIIENGNDIIRENQEIILTGNLTIENNGKLTFKNVTLKMNCSKNGEYRIKIKFKGEFYLHDNDGDKSTIYDSSNITNNGNYAYLFNVEDGATMEMKYSKLNGCGYEDENPGLITESKDVWIIGCNISNNHYGIFCDSKSPRIFDNTFFNNHAGIYSLYSKPSINENNISGNTFGIICEDSEPEIFDNLIEKNGIGVNCFENSNPVIRNNKILLNTVGIKCSSSNPGIEDNTISNNKDSGIELIDSNSLIFHNKIQNNDVALNCDSGSPELINCTIKASKTLDIYLDDDSHPILLSTKFDKDKINIFDSDSNLTIKWYLNVSVVDKNQNPVNKANVRVRDNEKGNFDENYTTNSEGWVKGIVITEYVKEKYIEIEFTEHIINASKMGITGGLTKKIKEEKNLIIELDLEIDTTPPKISNIQKINIAANSATITWDTDELSDSYIEYEKTKSYGLKVYNSTLTMTHKIKLTNLDKDTTYYFKVSSKDESDNNAVSKDDTFKTLTLLEITNVKAEEITQNSAVITWQTNEKSTSMVQFGRTDAYGKNSAKIKNLVIEHHVELTGLEGDTTYHFIVISEDSNNNEVISGDYTFTTEKKPDITIEIDMDDYEIEEDKEIIIIAKITNNEKEKITVDIYLMDSNNILYDEKKVSIGPGLTKEISQNWTADIIGIHKFIVIVEINDIEVARKEIPIDVVEKEKDNGGICIVGYLIPLVVLGCMVIMIRKIKK